MRPALRRTALCVLVAAGLGHAHARADFPALQTWELVNADGAMAAGGVLLYRTFAPMSAAPRDPPALFDTSQPSPTQLDGTFAAPNVEIETDIGYLVFVPAAPLQTGQMLGVSSSMGAAFEATLEVADPIGDASPTLQATVTLVGAPQLVERVCCAEGAIGSASLDRSCIPLRQSDLPRLNVKEVASPYHPRSRQFLYEARLTSPAQLAAAPGWVPASGAEQGWTLDATAHAPEYCYRVNAHRLTDGLSFVVDEDCIENTLPPPALRRPTLDEIHAALAIFQCSAPPVGFEEAWCTANEQACSSFDQASCAMTRFAQICAAFGEREVDLGELVEQSAIAAGLVEPLDQPTSENDGGMSHAGMSAGSAGMSAGNAGMSAGNAGTNTPALESDAGDASASSAGCACDASRSAQAPARSTRVMWLALGLLLTARSAASRARSTRSASRRGARDL